MTKPLLVLNREYDYRCFIEEREAAKRRPRDSFIRSIFFYGLLIAVVAIAFVYSSGDNSGQKFGPFAYNTVLTSSMTSVYPKGSLVTSWMVKPGEPLRAGLEHGDDIVFVREDGMVIVHRIIDIMENYEESGQRGFRTQGTDNPFPDDWITYEGNVIGRVTWHVEYVGEALAYVAEHIIWVLGVLVAVLVLMTMLKIVFRKESQQDTGRT